MSERRTAPERLAAFSDGVFAVIITILVLDLKPPAQATLAALLPLWPTALSYVISYLFIAIIRINHHRLLRFAHDATPRLIWWNFAHLFMVSLILLSTAWIAATRLAAAPVLIYAAVFVLVNIAFLAFQEETLSQASDSEATPKTPTDHPSASAHHSRNLHRRGVHGILVSPGWLWFGLLRTAYLSAATSSRRRRVSKRY